jgi:hypothetical protein
VPKSGPLGSVRGALSNERPYREPGIGTFTSLHAMRAAEDGQKSRTNSTTPGFDAVGVRCMVELKGNKALEAARVDSHGFGSLE